MNYTEQAKEVLKIAKKTARELRHPYIGTEHLLVGLKRVYTGVAGQVLAMNGAGEENILKIMDELVSPGGEVPAQQDPQMSPRLEYILEEAQEEAVRLRSDEVGTEHMLLAILRDVDCVAARILLTLNISLQKLCQDILASTGNDAREYMEDMQGEGKPRSSVLEQYGTDLTQQAAEGKLDPVIGREKEISRLMQILSRRTKNNPCLVGEPGVGKTAVLEGLAQRIAGGLVPETMKNRRIVTMDLAGMIAGSKYRGEFEERMKRLIQEVTAAGNVILFLDEVHTIIGAGGAEGAMDASNILKPSLARGNCSSSAPPPLWSTANTLKRMLPWRDVSSPLQWRNRQKRSALPFCGALRSGMKRTTMWPSARRRWSRRSPCRSATSATGSCRTRRSTCWMKPAQR